MEAQMFVAVSILDDASFVNTDQFSLIGNEIASGSLG
jgi:hypothetical protein